MPALAQNYGPWTVVSNAPIGIPAFNYAETTVGLPGPSGAVWGFTKLPHGMGVTDYSLYASADNCASWQDAAPLSIYDLWPLSAQEAWLVGGAAGSSGVVLRHTTTGPAGLATIASQPPIDGRVVRFFTASLGLVLGAVPGSPATWVFYRTTDGGQSWQPVTGLPAITVASSLPQCAVLGTHLWLTDYQGHLLHTPDAGLTWTTAAVPAGLGNLAFRDAQHGLAYTTTDLYRTTDGGATWTLVTLPSPYQWSGLVAIPGSAGTYLGSGTGAGSTRISYDEGQTWQSLGGTDAVRGLVANGSGQVFATVYGSGRVVRFTGSLLAATAARPPGAGVGYPNPTTGLVTLPAAGAYQQAVVYDATGRCCRTATLGPAETTLDLSSFAPGLYLLHFGGGTAAPSQQRLLLAR